MNSKARLLDLIASAKATLLLETLELADADVRAAVIDKKQAGLADFAGTTQF